ncbi:MAG: TRAP transporter small permease [Succinivibrionaceae bacterium]|nr:TRAP transporter small permease [Succinivibrionaceae bacterium]
MNLRSMLDRGIFVVCSVILCLMVADVTWQVTSRYLLSDPASFTDEVARFLMIWLALLGGAYLFGTKGHLAVTMLVDKFSERNRYLVTWFSYLLVLFFASFSLIYGGINLVMRTAKQVSPAVHLPMGLVYSILPISGCLIILYVVLNLRELRAAQAQQQGGE